MRRAFFFIVASLFAATSYASIPRASMLDAAPPAADSLSETRIRVSDVLAPFERPAESELTRALHQGYGDVSTTKASGLGRFLSVDPKLDLKRTLRNPQGWNRYAYVLNNPLRYVDPKGLIQYEAFLLGRSITVDISDDLTKRQQAALKRQIDNSPKALNDKAEAGKLTRRDFGILSNIQEVRVVQSRIVNGQETRSSVDERTGVFTMTDKYVSGSSAKWTASAIGHDAFHVQQFNEGGYSASRGLQSERPAMEYQLGLGRRIGLDAWSLGYLQDLINDPARLEQYRQSPAAADHED